ncbi:hypothetical protein FLPS103535_12100 [Flavobacterium psychrophilum]
MKIQFEFPSTTSIVRVTILTVSTLLLIKILYYIFF